MKYEYFLKFANPLLESSSYANLQALRFLSSFSEEITPSYELQEMTDKSNIVNQELFFTNILYTFLDRVREELTNDDADESVVEIDEPLGVKNIFALKKLTSFETPMFTWPEIEAIIASLRLGSLLIKIVTQSDDIFALEELLRKLWQESKQEAQELYEARPGDVTTNLATEYAFTLLAPDAK